MRPPSLPGGLPAVPTVCRTHWAPPALDVDPEELAGPANGARDIGRLRRVACAARIVAGVVEASDIGRFSYADAVLAPAEPTPCAPLVTRPHGRGGPPDDAPPADPPPAPPGITALRERDIGDMRPQREANFA